MPLTPEDVSNKRFTPVRLREGYDMGEVDQFLDEVEAELARLTKENDDLRAKLSAAQTGSGNSGFEPPATAQTPAARGRAPAPPAPPRPPPAPPGRPPRPPPRRRRSRSAPLSLRSLRPRCLRQSRPARRRSA